MFWSDDVHDALADVAHAKEGNTEVSTILLQRPNLYRTEGIGDAQRPIGGRDVVVRHRQRGAGTSRTTARELESFKGLRRRDFVDELAIYIEQGGPIRF